MFVRPLLVRAGRGSDCFTVADAWCIAAAVDAVFFQFTGADLSAVASNALQLALRRRVAEIEAQVRGE